MMTTDDLKTIEIEALLDNILLQRDVFQSDTAIDIWKSAYFGVYGISTLLNNQVKQRIWRKTEIEAPLKHLQKTTNRFVRQIRRYGKDKGAWAGCSEECVNLLQQYQAQCIADLQVLITTLDKNDPVRQDIEAKFPQLLA